MARIELNTAQIAALEEVRDGHASFKEARATLRAALEVELRERIAALEVELALKVRKAYEMGVPKARIANEGLSTTARRSVTDWLERTERMAARIAASQAPFGMFSWNNRATGSVNVEFTGYPTTLQAGRVADDYPPVLRGVARRDDSAPNGWIAESDPQTKQTSMGPLPGWFTVEIEQVPKSVEGSLVSHLDRWLAENS